VIRTATRLISLLVPALAAFLVSSGTASAKPPCWKVLINDWYDGRIDNVYPVSCYREALKHLPTDVEQYSSARDDINRALAALVAAKPSGPKAGSGQGNPAAKPGVAPTSRPSPTTTEPAATPPAAVTPPPPSPPAAAPTSPSSPQTSPRAATKPATPSRTGGSHAKPKPSTRSAGTRQASPPTTKSTAPAPSTGRQPSTGPVRDAINSIGPDKADSLPIPLLVLGSLAILLLLLGTAGFIARRLQVRRAQVRPQPRSQPAQKS
jgi:hypothetical protein